MKTADEIEKQIEQKLNDPARYPQPLRDILLEIIERIRYLEDCARAVKTP